MQDKTWYSILGLDAERLFLQDHMLSDLINLLIIKRSANSLAFISSKKQMKLFNTSYSPYF